MLKCATYIQCFNCCVQDLEKDMHTTLYAELGGHKAVEQIVDDFYKRILADDTVNHFFAHTDMDLQRRHQTAFISYALGGTNEYTGRSMEKAHALLNLQPEHFDAIVKHLGDALAARNMLPENINAVLGQVATLREAILYR